MMGKWSRRGAEKERLLRQRPGQRGHKNVSRFACVIFYKDQLTQFSSGFWTLTDLSEGN